MKTEYDAIVIGTGVSGGWAAKELCEKGLKTLVLERGRMLSHPQDYTTANMDHWDFPSADRITNEIKKNQPKQIQPTKACQNTTEHGPKKRPEKNGQTKPGQKSAKNGLKKKYF